MKTSVSLSHKIVVCLLTGLTAAAAILRLGKRFLSSWIPMPVVIGVAAAALVVALVYPWLWHRRDTGERPATVLAFWEGALRMIVALDLAMFGWQKIFHLQFNVPLAMLDEPFSSLTGEWLTWAYFGHSYAFVVFVGISQIAGATLLVFRKTKLLGAIVCTPILLNILVIDFFYQLPLGVLIHAVIMFACVVYLIATEYERLAQFFLRHDHAPSPWPGTVRVKQLLRLSVFYVPLILIVINNPPNPHPWLRGQYAVKGLQVNDVAATNTIGADSVLTLVYFDKGNECVMEFNGLHKRLYGEYCLNEKTHELKVTWHYPPTRTDTLFAVVQVGADATMLTGKIGDERVRAELKKVAGF